MNAPPRWSTRTETPSDIPAIHELNIAAFQRPDGAELVDALRHDSAWIEGLSMVVTAPDSAVVGHALLTRCHIGETPALCLAPCAVLPAYQRTGAGSAVIHTVLQAAWKMGEAFVVVLGHPHYYSRFGFERAFAHGISLSIEVPDEALMAMSLNPMRALSAGTVHYAAPFGI